MRRVILLYSSYAPVLALQRHAHFLRSLRFENRFVVLGVTPVK